MKKIKEKSWYSWFSGQNVQNKQHQIKDTRQYVQNKQHQIKEWPDNIHTHTHNYSMGFPGCWDGKEFACNAGDPGLIPGLGRFSGEVYSCPLQYSCLENFMHSGAWWATVHGFAKSWTLLSE